MSISKSKTTKDRMPGLDGVVLHDTNPNQIFHWHTDEAMHARLDVLMFESDKKKFLHSVDCEQCGPTDDCDDDYDDYDYDVDGVGMRSDGTCIYESHTNKYGEYIYGEDIGTWAAVKCDRCLEYCYEWHKEVLGANKWRAICEHCFCVE